MVAKVSGDNFGHKNIEKPKLGFTRDPHGLKTSRQSEAGLMGELNSRRHSNVKAVAPGERAEHR